MIRYRSYYLSLFFSARNSFSLLMLVYELYTEIGKISTDLVVALENIVGKRRFVQHSGRESQRYQKPVDEADECQ